MDEANVERASFTSRDEEDDLWSWRSDPERNHSDLKIVAKLKYLTEVDDDGKSRDCSGYLVVKEENDTNDTTEFTTYHVHKNVLANGRRKGAYFWFLNDGLYAETNSSEIRLDFEHPSAVKAFEAMLDYVYSWPDSLSKVIGKTPNKGVDIVALRTFADYFDVPTLLHEVDTCIKKDISVDNIYTYISKAMEWNQEQILDFTINFAARNDKALMWKHNGKKSTINFDFVKLFPAEKRTILFMKCYLQKCSPPVADYPPISSHRPTPFSVQRNL